MQIKNTCRSWPTLPISIGPNLRPTRQVLWLHGAGALADFLLNTVSRSPAES